MFADVLIDCGDSEVNLKKVRIHLCTDVNISKVNSRTILKYLFTILDGCPSCEVCQVQDDAEMRSPLHAVSTS